MPKVAVLGANGQVGAELCLLLSRRPEVETVPICRNRTGSAFLRYCGIACRHGHPADPHDAPRLLGDCDAVVNSALASGTPRQIRCIENKLIHNAVAFSKPGATIIHFSTQSVYGDPRAGRLIRWQDPYGSAKLASERLVRREARRTGKPAFLLRLGHVCGEFQNISQDIRRSLLDRMVVLTQLDVISNTVYTATIVDAILTILAGKEISGTYDLMNQPQWTWRQVYEQEARLCRGRFEAVTAEVQARRSLPAQLRQVIVRAAGEVATAPVTRRLGAMVLAYLPEPLSARAQAWWHCKRARAEISSLRRSAIPPEHLSFVANGHSFLRSLSPTAELLAENPYRELASTGRGRWPADLPDAKTEAC
jgi:nucleoside-diphosphate-sugar epimerase